MTSLTSARDAERFTALLRQIDEVLDRYDDGGAEPGSDRTLGEVFRYRAAQRHVLERAVGLATAALSEFPHNGELLRRRGLARCRIVTETGEHPALAEGEADLRTMLRFEPNTLAGGIDLLGELFAFSGLEDLEVAGIAEQLAERAQALMLQARTLQVRALAYAGRPQQAREVAETWMRLFPDTHELEDAAASYPPAG
jgi:hypothetical protein